MKTGEQKGRLLWRALEREPITEIWGQSRNCLEAGGILVLGDTFLRCPGACSDRTEAYIWYCCYFECKRQNGAGVSHLEVLCDFLQDRLIAAFFWWLPPVRAHISETTHPIVTKFSVPVTYRHGPIVLRRRCDMLCISGFVDDVMFARSWSGAGDASRAFYQRDSPGAARVWYRGVYSNWLTMRQQTAACLRRWKWKPTNTVMSGVCGDFSAFSPCPWLCALSLNGRTCPGVSSNSLDVVFGKHSNFLLPFAGGSVTKWGRFTEGEKATYISLKICETTVSIPTKKCYLRVVHNFAHMYDKSKMAEECHYKNR